MPLDTRGRFRYEPFGDKTEEFWNSPLGRLLQGYSKFANTPLLSKAQEDTKNYLADDPSLGGDNPYIEGLKGAGKGALQGLVDVGANFTTPINLLQLITGLGAGSAARAGIATGSEPLLAAAKGLSQLDLGIQGGFVGGGAIEGLMNAPFATKKLSEGDYLGAAGEMLDPSIKFAMGSGFGKQARQNLDLFRGINPRNEILPYLKDALLPDSIRKIAGTLPENLRVSVKRVGEQPHIEMPDAPATLPEIGAEPAFGPETGAIMFHSSRNPMRLTPENLPDKLKRGEFHLNENYPVPGISEDATSHYQFKPKTPAGADYWSPILTRDVGSDWDPRKILTKEEIYNKNNPYEVQKSPEQLVKEKGFDPILMYKNEAETNNVGTLGQDPGIISDLYQKIDLQNRDPYNTQDRIDAIYDAGINKYTPNSYDIFGSPSDYLELIASREPITEPANPGLVGKARKILARDYGDLGAMSSINPEQKGIPLSEVISKTKPGLDSPVDFMDELLSNIDTKEYASKLPDFTEGHYKKPTGEESSDYSDWGGSELNQLVEDWWNESGNDKQSPALMKASTEDLIAILADEKAHPGNHPPKLLQEIDQILDMPGMQEGLTQSEAEAIKSLSANEDVTASTTFDEFVKELDNEYWEGNLKYKELTDVINNPDNWPSEFVEANKVMMNKYGSELKLKDQGISEDETYLDPNFRVNKPKWNKETGAISLDDLEEPHPLEKYSDKELQDFKDRIDVKFYDATPNTPEHDQLKSLKDQIDSYISYRAANPIAPKEEDKPTSVDKLAKLLQLSQQQRAETSVLYGKDRSQRAHQLKEIFEKKLDPITSIVEAKKALTGKLRKAKLSEIGHDISEEELGDMWKTINEHPKLGQYEKVTALDALLRRLDPNEEVPLQDSEIKLLRQIFDIPEGELPDQAKSSFDTIADILNVPRSLKSTLDLSAPLRQGALFVSRPKEFGDAFVKMFKYAASEKGYNELADQIIQSPNNELYHRTGLEFTGFDEGLSHQEEAFMSAYAKKIPGLGTLVRASDRGYSGFLNKLRQNVFDSVANKWKAKGIDIENSPQEYKALAEMINMFTGRAKLPGKVEKAAPFLNTIFFSPKFNYSRLKTMSPITYARMPKLARQEALRDLIGSFTIGTTVLGMAQAAGASVELDPRSSDFGQMRFGNMRIDPWAGFRPWVNLITQIGSGERKTLAGNTKELNSGKWDEETKLDVLGRFVRSKFSPGVELGADYLAGKDLVGRPFDEETVGNAFMPMFIQDMREIMRDDPSNVPLGMPASFFGAGVKVIPERETGAKTKSSLPKLKPKRVKGH